jgi:hypothetical protein
MYISRFLKETTSIVVETKVVSEIVRISVGKAKIGEGSVEREGITEHFNSDILKLICGKYIFIAV